MALCEFMAVLTLLSILSLLFVPKTTAQFQNHHRGHVSLAVSQTGLDFAKDILIQNAISTMIPLHISDIEKKVKIPLVGSVHLALSDIQIYDVYIQSSSSSFDAAENGVVLDISGAMANLSMNWSYAYTLLFVKISDYGNASVKVLDMDMRLAISLIEHNGSLTISVLKTDCNVKSIEIDVDGGASWLYQEVVDAFQNKIISAVEDTVSNKIEEKMEKLEFLLQSIPKEKKINEFASLNLTFTKDPVVSNSSVEVEINGLFIQNDKALVSDQYYLRTSLQPSFFFGNLNKMVELSLEELVFNSATMVYFNANRMNLVVDRTYNRSILNTAYWKLILPELYRRYPDHKMKLVMSVTSPPAVKITEKGIDAIIHLDAKIDVLDSGGAVIPMACISSILNASCSADISQNKLTGSLRLVEFSASIKWSKFGSLSSQYVQAAMSTILEAVFLPDLNARLKRGFPLPIPHIFIVNDAKILFANSRVTICSDISLSTLI